MGSIDETSGGLPESESVGPPHAEVGLDYGQYWSGKGDSEVRSPVLPMAQRSDPHGGGLCLCGYELQQRP